MGSTYRAGRGKREFEMREAKETDEAVKISRTELLHTNVMSHPYRPSPWYGGVGEVPCYHQQFSNTSWVSYD